MTDDDTKTVVLQAIEHELQSKGRTWSNVIGDTGLRHLYREIDCRRKNWAIRQEAERRWVLAYCYARQYRLHVADLLDNPDALAPDCVDPQTQAEKIGCWLYDPVRSVRAAAEALPDDLLAIVADYYWAGRSMESIGKDSGITKQAVDKKLKKARDLMRTALSQE